MGRRPLPTCQNRPRAPRSEGRQIGAGVGRPHRTVRVTPASFHHNSLVWLPPAPPSSRHARCYPGAGIAAESPLCARFGRRRPSSPSPRSFADPGRVAARQDAGGGTGSLSWPPSARSEDGGPSAANADGSSTSPPRGRTGRRAARRPPRPTFLTVDTPPPLPSFRRRRRSASLRHGQNSPRGERDLRASTDLNGGPLASGGRRVLPSRPSPAGALTWFRGRRRRAARWIFAATSPGTDETFFFPRATSPTAGRPGAADRHPARQVCVADEGDRELRLRESTAAAASCSRTAPWESSRLGGTFTLGLGGSKRRLTPGRPQRAMAGATAARQRRSSRSSASSLRQADR